MVGDVLGEGGEGVVKNQCLLQRAFAFNTNALLVEQRTVSLDLLAGHTFNTNALLAGHAPWESAVREGMVDSQRPGAGTVDAHMHLTGILSAMLHSLQTHKVQMSIACGLCILMIGFVVARSRHKMHGARKQGAGLWFHIAMACFSGFLRGYGLYVISPFLMPVQRSLQLCYPCAGGTSDIALVVCSCPWKEFAVSSVALGAIFGGLVGGSLADAVGRRITLMVSDVLFIVSSLLMGMSGTGAFQLPFFVGRVLAGIAVGASGPASHAYISELVPPRYRGQMLTLIELATIAGVCMVFAFASLLGDEKWRRSIAFPMVPAVIQLCCTALFLHESPRWLAACGRIEEAQHVVDALGLETLSITSSLQDAKQAKHTAATLCLEPRVHTPETHHPSPEMATPYNQPSALHKLQRSGLATLLHHRRRVVLAMCCALAHNALGANIVMYYSRDILQLANIGNSFGNSMGLGAAKAPATGIAFVAVDRCGRRFLLIVGMTGAVMGHLGLAVAFLPSSVAFGPGLAWASLLLFLTAWDLGWATLMAVVISEVLPDDVRGLGLGVSCSLYWLVSFVQAQTLETMFKQITISGTFAMYCFTSMVGLLFVIFYVPETCGRSLDAE